MEKRLLFRKALHMTILCIALFGFSQINAQLTLSGSAYTETFDGLNTTIPTGWTVRTTATAVTRGTAQAFSTTQGDWASTTAGFKNYASSEGLISSSNVAAQNASTDRALGVRQSGSFGDPGASFELEIANTINRTGFALQFKNQILSSQPRSTTWSAQYSTNGGTLWTTLGTFTDPGAFGSTGASYSFGTNLDNIAGTVLIRVVTLTPSTGSNNRDTFGVDDFVLSWTNATTPALATTSNSLAFGSHSVNTQSGSQTFNLSGSNLTGAPGNITVNATNTDFQVSNDNNTWGASTQIAYTAATLANTAVYVRFTPQSSGAKSGNITFSGGGVSTPPTVAVSGNGVLEAPVALQAANIKNTEFTAQWNAVSGATSYRLDVSSTPFASISSVPWINEFHYDNAGAADTNEFVEVIVPATYSGTGLTLTFYNGSGGATYGTSVTLAQMTAGESNALYTVYSYTTANDGVQNGAPDGFSLSDAGGLIQLISYEGTFTATNGPASGTLSTEISPALSETNTTLVGSSLELTGSGTSYNSFAWASVLTNTKGAINSGQNIGSATYVIQDQNVGNNTSYTVTGLNPDTPYYYRVRAVDANSVSGNSNTISVNTIAETVWNGTVWSDGTPNANLNAIIEGPYDTATDNVFTAKSLTINTGGSMTINSGTNITIVNQVTNTLTAAAFVIENNANLLQLGVVNVNSGDVTVRRNASMRRQDYVYWSSPVAGQNLEDFSPDTLPNRFYELNETTNLFTSVNPETTDFVAAKSFIIRAPNDFPNTPQTFNGEFIGVPNSGSYSIAVTNNNQGYNLIGNPYPSTISADAFLDENTSLGTIYFWTHTNQDAAAGENYATYNSTGQVAPSSTTPQSDSPNGAIQTGQGFMIQANAPVNVTFLNDMRIADNQDQFFRTQTVVEKNRIWLNLSGENETTIMNQILVGYVEGATNDTDLRYDGKLFSTEGTRIYSILNNDSYVIQGRALPFADNDVVAFGFKTPNAGMYRISLDHLDGLFAADQNVFIRDNYAGTTTNIKEDDYVFASNAGNFTNRFELVYQSAPLGINPIFDENAVIIYTKDNLLAVNSGAKNMQAIKVFDMSGRLLIARDNIKSTEMVLDNLNAENQLLLVQVTDVDGITVTKKAMY